MPSEVAVTPEMKASIGIRSEPVTWEVEKGEIVRFASAIGDPNPLYSDEAAARRGRYGGIIAPPTFLHAYGAPSLDFEYPSGVGLDGGSEWEYFEPVRPGDRITVTATIADIFEKQGRVGKMVFIVRDIEYVNQFGELAARRRSTGIFYDATKNPEQVAG